MELDFSGAHFYSHVRMTTAALLDKLPSFLPTAEACLSHVLGSKASPYPCGDLPSVAPYRLDLISWPEQTGACALVFSLPEVVRTDLSEVRGALRLDADALDDVFKTAGAARAYGDPALQSGGDVYVFFL